MKASQARHPDKAATPAAAARAVVTLEELVRLQEHASGFSFLPRQPVHSILTGRHSSRLRGRGLNFEELRHYAQGDDIRTIDWLTTARLRAPHVRVYTEERDRNVLLIVDQSLSMFFGSRRAMKSVAAAEAAGLSAWRVASLGDRIGAIVFSDEDIEVMSPKARRPSVLRILGAIAAKNAELPSQTRNPANPRMLNEALKRAAGLATHDWLICIISDMAGVDDETKRLISQIMAHNDLMAIFIYDKLEADLPDVGTAIVEEAGRQLEIDSSTRNLRERFTADFHERRTKLKQLAIDRSIPVLPVTADRDVADQIREALGHRLRPAHQERSGQ
jgi:uncharacterized protein (DUF58 family)